MNFKPQIDRIQGHSPDYLLRNLYAIQAKSPQLFESLIEFLGQHSFHVTPDASGAFTVAIQSDNGEEIADIAISPPSLFPPPLAARYQVYNPKRHWLIVFGIDALFPQRLHQMPISEFSPMILIEPDPAIFLAWAITRPLESILALSQTYLYVGQEAPQRFLDDIDEVLEPYFVTCDGLFLIPSPRFIQAKSILHPFTHNSQKTFAGKLQGIKEAGRQFAEYSRNPKSIRSGNVLILEPAVTCWITLGNGLAQGFRDYGLNVVERQVTFPPSAINARESLSILLEIQRLRPQYIVTLSHPSDLFARGIEKVPIPRLIWYVDCPDHLIQPPHGSYDILFPFWKEFETNLSKRGGNLSEVVSVPGIPYPSQYRQELACEVGFVGTVHDSRKIRSQIPTEIDRKMDAILDEKIRSIKTPFTDLYEIHGLSLEDRSIIVQILEEQYRKPGMTDEQVLQFFLHMESTTLYRLRVLEKLHEFDLKIYGNADWQSLLQDTAIANAYQGQGLNTEQCCNFFRSATISISPHPTYPHSGPNPRDMDIVMCGGFLLSDVHRHAGDRIRDFFEPITEIALFDGEDDIVSRVRFYLQHPDKRMGITKSGKQRILKDHTYADRVHQMVRIADSIAFDSTS